MTTARRVNTGFYLLVRLGNGPITGLKIRCPKGRAGSTPALGTTQLCLLQQLQCSPFDLICATLGDMRKEEEESGKTAKW